MEPMRTSRFSDEQALQILQEARSSTAVKVRCANHIIRPATFHTWKRKFGGMEVSEARRRRARVWCLAVAVCRARRSVVGQWFLAL